MNSIFTNNYFSNTSIDVSFFQKINIVNIIFINNTLNSCGIKLSDGNASKLFMNSLQFRNMNLDDNLFVFDSLYSIIQINDLQLDSLSFTKSK